MINASAVNTLNQVPLVNSTQILTQSAQVPQMSQIPVTASTPIMSQVPVTASTPIMSTVPVTASTPVISQAPMAVPQQVMTTNSHFGTATVGTLVDEDYRLGRGILDEFRPAQINASLGILPSTAINTTTTIANTTPLVSTPLVSTPAVTTPVTLPTGGANVLKEFL